MTHEVHHMILNVRLGVPEQLCNDIGSELAEFAALAACVVALLKYALNIMACKELNVGGQYMEVGEGQEILSEVGCVVPDIKGIGDFAPIL